ncbi:MAG: hypothetical protein ACRD8O_08730 [Bryobacteraceae bacterium]
MMAKDPIVEEIRQVREGLAARYNYDPKAMLAAAKKRQRKSGRRVVSFLTKKKLTA